MTAAALFWACLSCPATGTTTGTESGADKKHADAEGHATNTHLHPWVETPAEENPVSDIPNLVFEYPVCEVCDDDGDMNYSGDNWWCEKCATTWDKSGEHGRHDPA